MSDNFNAFSWPPGILDDEKPIYEVKVPVYKVICPNCGKEIEFMDEQPYRIHLECGICEQKCYIPDEELVELTTF